MTSIKSMSICYNEEGNLFYTDQNTWINRKLANTIHQHPVTIEAEQQLTDLSLSFDAHVDSTNSRLDELQADILQLAQSFQEVVNERNNLRIENNQLRNATPQRPPEIDTSMNDIQDALNVSPMMMPGFTEDF